MEHENRVILVSEPGRASDDIADILRRYHDVELVPLDTMEPPDLKDCLLIVFDVDLSRREVVGHLRKVFKLDAASSVPLLFILNELHRREVVQIHSLGGQDFVVRPLHTIEVLPVLRSLVNSSVEERWNQLSPVQAAALKVSLKVFEDMMEQAFVGEPLPALVIRESCKSIVEATAHDDLESWVRAIRDHHNYTYRHSMLVSGFLISFAHLVGIRGEDLEALALGAMLHDIGKAVTPLDILDKPGQLNDEEWQVMRQHPVESRRILERESQWEENIIDAAAHHHERLDGTGYPDGLKKGKISDMVRMISVADVFSALVDKRAYKAPRDGREAYELMLTMEGQLDLDLVKAFKPIALGRSNRR